MSIVLQEIKLHHLQMALKNPFTTSFGTFQEKDFFIIEMMDQQGNRGYGESVAFPIPWYTEETFVTTAHMIQDVLIPMLKGKVFEHPDEVAFLFRKVKRNHMAKAALEGAIWDLYAKKRDVSLAEALGGVKQTIDVGVSLGIDPHLSDTLQKIAAYKEEGYKRIKVKIKPGYDLVLLQEIRTHFPDIPLMADANSAYTLNDRKHLQQLDQFDLIMIEQPLHDEDIYNHSILQKEMKTPICLDESIHTYEDARLAIELGSCQIINIKQARVGGLTEAKRIHDLCHENGIGVWCGGMLEAGIGRAHNIALSTLAGFVYPGDTSGSNRYWDKDIISPEVKVEDGIIHVPKTPGIGYQINEKTMEQFTKEIKVIKM